MKRGSDYKMPKTVKRIMALSKFTHSNDKYTYKSAMIDADIHAQEVRKRASVPKTNNDE